MMYLYSSPVTDTGWMNAWLKGVLGYLSKVPFTGDFADIAAPITLAPMMPGDTLWQL